MRNKLGTLCMIVGAVLVFAALALFCMNQSEAEEAAQASEQIMPQIVRQIEDRTADVSDTALPLSDPYDSDMTEVVIDGYSYIGYVSVPSLGIELPVMSQWDYDRLKIAPCRYSGSVKTDYLVIAGHNYRRHFGGLSRISEGDRVYFVDMDGNQFCYDVGEVEVLAPTAVEEMKSSGWDLTLFTCTYGGRTRLAIRCEKVPQKNAD